MGDPEVLIVSIQQELDQENGISPQQSQPQPQQQFPQNQQQQFPQNQQNFQQQPQQFTQNQQQFSQNPQQPRQLTRGDIRALQKQEETLNDIIKLQNSLNFPGQS